MRTSRSKSAAGSTGSRSSAARGRRGRARRARLVLHDLLPIDDAVAGGAGLDRLAALQDVEELGRDVHVAALAGAVADADDRQAPAQPDAAVTLEHVGLHVGRQLVALDAQLGNLRLDLGHARLGRVAVLRDRRLQRLDVAGAIREQLLLRVDGLDQLRDLALARDQRLATLLDLALRRHVLLRVLGLRQLVLGAGDLHLVVGHQALLLGVVAFGLAERLAFAAQQSFDSRKVVLRRRELHRYRAKRAFEFLNLCVVSLQFLESRKLVAQFRFLRGVSLHVFRKSPPDPGRVWAHLDSNQGPGGYEPPALTAELWAQLCTGAPYAKACAKENQTYTPGRRLSSDSPTEQSARNDARQPRNRRRRITSTRPASARTATVPCAMAGAAAQWQPEPGGGGGGRASVDASMPASMASAPESLLPSCAMPASSSAPVQTSFVQIVCEATSAHWSPHRPIAHGLTPRTSA